MSQARRVDFHAQLAVALPQTPWIARVAVGYAARRYFVSGMRLPCPKVKL